MSKVILILGTIVVINSFLPSILCQADFSFAELDGSKQIESNEQISGEDDGNDWVPIYEIPSTISKRDPTFWPTHPSDYTPMRRPPGKPLIRKTLNNKKSEGATENPYHPVPRAVNQHQKNAAKFDDDEWPSSRVQKRQSPGSYLLMKLSRKPKDSTSRKIRRRS